jgi:secreted trypsin-like serine protease
MRSTRVQRLTRQRCTRRPSIEILEERELYIVGGMEVAIEQAPFVISLQRNGSHICGGSLIGERHVLTAAHCVTGWVQPNQVVVNRTDLRTNTGK